VAVDAREMFCLEIPFRGTKLIYGWDCHPNLV
jgi:hypothetical protein